MSNTLKEDLLVWAKFLDTYNGRSFFQSEFVFAPDFRLFTDAAGSKGFVAIWGTHWCCVAWLDSWISKISMKNVVLLELFPILVAMELWGACFANRRIFSRNSNKGVLFAVNCLSSSSLLVIKVLRQTVFLCLKYNVWLKAKYTPGRLNVIADSVSRFQMDRYFQMQTSRASGTQRACGR